MINKTLALMVADTSERKVLIQTADGSTLVGTLLAADDDGVVFMSTDGRKHCQGYTDIAGISWAEAG